MKVISSIPELRALLKGWRAAGETIGLVPTMGALHKGHVSLLERARARTGKTVMSIFVNPSQFGPKEDFNKYPRTLEADCAMAEAVGCDAVFTPAAADMYPDHYHTYVTVDDLSGVLCGVTRPTHFRGVATVVLKFFNIVQPDIAFFGAKDAQQVIVLKRMVADLNVPVTIEVSPTLREADGLAMSSRNRYLTPAERNAAPAIFKGLGAAAALFEKGERAAGALRAAFHAALADPASGPLLQPEYLEIVSTTTLQPLTEVRSTALIATACRTLESGTRLIDNIVVGGPL